MALILKQNPRIGMTDNCYWRRFVYAELISTSLGHAMGILKDKDRYNGKAGLYVEDRDNPEIPFLIPFIDYGSIDADRITEDWRQVHWVR